MITWSVTYDSELIESLKQLRREVNVLRSDVGIHEVDKLSRLCNNVERLEVVRLFTQIVLSSQQHNSAVSAMLYKKA